MTAEMVIDEDKIKTAPKSRESNAEKTGTAGSQDSLDKRSSDGSTYILL